MELILFPNELLTLPCSTVEKDIAKIREQGKAMFDLMYQHKGIGLSAPQVGILNRVMIIDTTGIDSVNGWKGLIINPILMSQSNLKRKVNEGCLSFPDKRIDIMRPLEVSVRFKNSVNKQEFRKFKGITAACFMHEYSHLRGKLFIDEGIK